MKPTSLKSGDQIKLIGDHHVLTFVRRIPSEGGRPAVNVVHNPRFAHSTLTDSQICRLGIRV